jgi:hypothetical protein
MKDKHRDSDHRDRCHDAIAGIERFADRRVPACELKGVRRAVCPTVREVQPQRKRRGEDQDQPPQHDRAQRENQHQPTRQPRLKSPPWKHRYMYAEYTMYAPHTTIPSVWTTGTPDAFSDVKL